jgi:hypothetical protein
VSRYEQPSYTVVGSRPDYELRRYEPYLAAETEVAGDFDDTGNTAFRRLAGFIFGRNSTGVKMNMTVPVTRQETGAGSYRYRFVMESAYSESDLPRPVDEAVSIVRIPGGYYAARAYRGRWTESTYRRIEAKLIAALDRDGIPVAGAPFSAVYDGPFTPPMLRHNEVLVEVAWQDAGTRQRG